MFTDTIEWNIARQRTSGQGASQGQIALQLVISRKTMQKMLNLTWPPGQHKHLDCPVPLGPWIPVIDRIVRENKMRPKSMQISPRMIWQYLCKEHEFKASFSMVNVYVRQARSIAALDVISVRELPGRRLQKPCLALKSPPAIAGKVIAPSLRQSNRELEHRTISKMEYHADRSERNGESEDQAFQWMRGDLQGTMPLDVIANETTNVSLSELQALVSTSTEQTLPMCCDVICTIIKEGGWKWRRARIVLTSNDPEYGVKVDAVKKLLSELKSDEAFFSIDEYGPFAIKQKGGVKQVAPGEQYVVPQWQKSKGWLILTAAIELSRDQVTHFYSRKKNTGEMIKLADPFRTKYHTCSTIYLSWDAASWHVSKDLGAYMERINQEAITDGFPIVKTAPLPTCSQFLNVIESVFSGMARAIIHNSDYPSVEAATTAIDRYFADRNEYFSKHPQKAGKKIWGKERVPSQFSEGQNCKDPLYQFPT